MTERPGENASPKPTLTDREGYLEAVLQPTSSSDLIKRQFEEVVQTCKARKPSRLFLDFSTITGKFSTLERYEFGVFGARLVPDVGRVAVLIAPDVIDPEKLGGQVARNRGLNIELFLDRAAAMAWLLAP
jgi:hypothetical protein